MVQRYSPPCLGYRQHGLFLVVVKNNGVGFSIEYVAYLGFTAKPDTHKGRDGWNFGQGGS